MKDYNLEDISVFMKARYKYNQDAIIFDEVENAFEITIHSL